MISDAVLRREAALAARLNAPHIVPIHDYGEIDGRLFIEMPLISGVELGALLGAGSLPPQRPVVTLDGTTGGIWLGGYAGCPTPPERSTRTRCLPRHLPELLTLERWAAGGS